MMNNYLITIITIVFNDKLGLAKTLNSIKTQKCKFVESIVIDGLSTDGSYEIALQNKNLIDQFIYEKDNGIYDAMNKGINLAKGQYILFLNAGDDLLDNSLSELLRSANRGLDIIFHPIVSQNERNIESIYKPMLPPFKMDPQHMYCPHPGMLVKKSVFEDLGAFDTNYKYAGDLDWANRMFNSNKYQVEISSIPITKFYAGGGSSTILSFKETRDIAIKFGKPRLRAYVRYFKTVLMSYLKKL